MNSKTLEAIIEEIRDLEQKLKEEGYSSTKEVYDFLTFDREAVEFLNKDKSILDKLVKAENCFNDKFEWNPKRDSPKYFSRYMLASNSTWCCYGRYPKEEDLFILKHMTFGITGKFYEKAAISFKYYIKPDMKTLLERPEDVMNFYEELLKEAYNAEEIHQFQIPSSFVTFVRKKQGFVFHLNKRKVEDFEHRVEQKMKKYHLREDEVKKELGFDVDLANGEGYSYNSLKAKELFEFSRNSPTMTPYDVYERLNDKILVEPKKLYQYYKKVIRPFED